MECYPTEDEGAAVPVEQALRLLHDDAEWQALASHPWPKRGPIYGFALTEAGRTLVRRS